MRNFILLLVVLSTLFTFTSFVYLFDAMHQCIDDGKILQSEVKFTTSGCHFFVNGKWIKEDFTE